MQIPTLMTAAAFLVLLTSASAQDYPKAPVRFTYPFAPGSSVDSAWRLINEEAGKHLGQPIVHLNKAGAGGRVGFSEVVKSKPDGYALVVVSNVTAVVQPLLDPMAFKTVPGTDFTPIILGFEYPLILVARKSAPFIDYKSFLAFAKQNPGKLNGGSPGIGTGPHLGLAALNMKEGVQITHVPYASNPLLVQAMLAGDLDVMWTDTTAKPHLEAGTMIALGVASPKRWNLFPNVPTMEELGVSGIVLQAWNGVAGPPGMPQHVVDALNTAYGKAMRDPAVHAKLTKEGWNLLGGKPSDLVTRVTEGLAYYEPIIRQANLSKQ